MDARKINQFAINAFLAANEMPLDFNKNISKPESINKKPRAIFCVLGSTGCQSVVCGTLPQTWNETPRVWRNCVRQAAGRDRLAACAPQSEERDQSLRKLRQFIPSHSAFSFLAPQMRLG